MKRKFRRLMTAILVVVARAVAEEILTHTLRRRGAPRNSSRKPT